MDRGNVKRRRKGRWEGWARKMRRRVFSQPALLAGLAGEWCSFLAAEAREDWRLSHHPLHRTIRILPVTLDYETTRTRLGIRQLVHGMYLCSQNMEEQWNGLVKDTWLSWCLPFLFLSFDSLWDGHFFKTETECLSERCPSWRKLPVGCQSHRYAHGRVVRGWLKITRC